MELVCPLCNGLNEIVKTCNCCGKNMVDEGPIVNYLDDYSPYLSNDITALVDGADSDSCMHLFKCNNCENDKRIEVKRMLI